MVNHATRVTMTGATWRSPRLILILALAFLILRNVPLGWIMPLWAFGDEMGHLDCAMKWGRGRVPQPLDRLEPALFELHRTRADFRYGSVTPTPPVTSLDQMRLGGYTYQAKHPPLVHWIMAVFLKLFGALGVSLFVQVKLFRMISLAAAAGGILVLYAGLRRTGRRDVVLYAPLLFIALLAQDIFFVVNTDTFSFLFGCCVLAGMMEILRQPLSRRAWVLCAAGTVLMMGTKIINGYVFGLWGLLGLVLWRKGADRHVRRLFLAGLLVALALSAPWYVYNFARYSNPAYYDYVGLFGKNPYVPAGISLPRAVEFVQAYTRTLFRGEMIWNGVYYDILHGASRDVLITAVPVLIFLLGLVRAFTGGKSPGNDPRDLEARSFLAIWGVLAIAGLVFGFFFIGGAPYYQVRLSLAILYPILFIFGLGWRAFLKNDDLFLAVPSSFLFIYNAAHTLILLGKVMT